MKLPKQEFKLMTRIKLIQFWTCFTGIVLTHPRNMYLWSVFWGVMLMYLPMVFGVFEIIMLRLHTFKDYGQLIFHVFVCLLWQLGFALLVYLWNIEDNQTTLGHALFYMNAFLGILFLLEIAIFVHVVRARINFLKRIDNEIEEREKQKAEEEQVATRSSVYLTRNEFVSRETILEKEKRELIQSIKERLENEMKIRESEEVGSAQFRTPRGNEISGDNYSEQIPRTSKTAAEEPSTSKTNDYLFVEESTTTKGDDKLIDYLNTKHYRQSSLEDPNTSKTGGGNSVEYQDVHPKETESIAEENPAEDQAVHPNETESIAEENLKEKSFDENSKEQDDDDDDDKKTDRQLT